MTARYFLLRCNVQFSLDSYCYFIFTFLKFCALTLFYLFIFYTEILDLSFQIPLAIFFLASSSLQGQSILAIHFLVDGLLTSKNLFCSCHLLRNSFSTQYSQHHAFLFRSFYLSQVFSGQSIKETPPLPSAIET